MFLKTVDSVKIICGSLIPLQIW